MAALKLKELIGKLNETCRQSLEGAAGLCLSRTNYNVEIEHWLLKLLERTDTDFAALLKHYGVNTSRLSADLTKQIDRLKTGNSRPPALSPDIVDLVREAWLIGTVNFGERAVRSGHLLCALLAENAFLRTTSRLTGGFEHLSAEKLQNDFLALTSKTAEAIESEQAAPVGPGAAAKPTGPTKTPALDQYTIDLTARARNGDIDPVLGRDPEIRQIIDILTRRRQNNPILTGEAGVGKTAVVEGFALRIAAGDVPETLRSVSLRTLDLGLLQAGAGVRGEFENRLKSVIEEVKRSPTPIILFIDEAHTMIGAGGQVGGGDAANLLKPALARGELRTIAATTWAEYKQYFEKDAALARRFQVVKVEEPDVRAAIEMMRGLVDTLERHHGVRILNEGVTEAVRLSQRYISGRQLPDKAVSTLDTTCARIALSQQSTPPAIEDCRRRITQLGVAIDILTREMATGADHQKELEDLSGQREAAERELTDLEQRWQQEKRLVDQIRHLGKQLELSHVATASRQTAMVAERPATDAGAGAEGSATSLDSTTDLATLRQELEAARTQLKQLQGEHPLIHVSVDAQAVAETVSAWTGIPLGRVVVDEVRTFLNLKTLMEQSIVGQSHALEVIAQCIRTSRANLADPRQPIGVFLLAGTSGVGKTETAITLANLLYGGEQNMTTINMSEYKEEHKVSLLLGPPPGYVGYGKGGVLTEAVRRKPYSIVLLDELEKAHRGVHDIFYQVFDKGTLSDSEGRNIDFKNTIILVTTNAGSELIKSLCADSDTSPDPEALTEAVHSELQKTFPDAFLGRMQIVPFYPLSDAVMRQIIELKLGKIARRVEENYGARFTYAPELVGRIAQRCTEVDTGARNVDHILTRTLLPEMSDEFLSRLAEGTAIQAVEVSIGQDGAFRYDIS